MDDMATCLRLAAIVLCLAMIGCGGETVTDVDSPAASPSIPILEWNPEPTPTLDDLCSTKDGAKALDLLNAVARRWDDALHLADSTPRIQLATQISNLQQIRRDVEDQDWPECAQGAQRALVKAMNAAIDGFIAFMTDKPDAEVSGHFSDYRAAMDWFANEIALLR